MKRKSWGIIASLGIIVFVWTFIVGHTNPSVTNSNVSLGVHGTGRNMCDIPIENNTENELEKRNQNKSYFKQDEDQQTDTHPVTNIHRKSQLVMQGTDPVDHSFDNKVSDKASNQWQRPAANQVQTQGYNFFSRKIIAEE